MTIHFSICPQKIFSNQINWAESGAPSHHQLSHYKLSPYKSHHWSLTVSTITPHQYQLPSWCVSGFRNCSCPLRCFLFIFFEGNYSHFIILSTSTRLQTFTRFVEVGRVVLINYGENKGKICTVIDIVDAKRVSLMINLHDRDYIDD